MPAVSRFRESSLVCTMKYPGLSRPLCAATLFLAVHCGAAEGPKPGDTGEQVAQRAADRLRDLPVEAIAPDGMTDAAKPVANVAADRAQRREWMMRFDRNGDGRLDEGERAALRAELVRRPGAAGKSLLEPGEAAQLRRILAEELAASAPPPETVVARLMRRRAESLQRAAPAK